MKRNCLAALLAALASAGSADAGLTDVLVDNLGDLDEWTAPVWIPNDQPAADYGLAASFSVPEGGPWSLTSVELGLSADPSGPNTFFVSIYADDGGLPGELVDSVMLADQVPLWNIDGGGEPPLSEVYTFALFGDDAVLDGGQTYWIAVEETGGSQFAWYSSSDASVSPLALDFGGWVDVSNPEQLLPPAYRVYGTVVPVPGVAAALLLAGLARSGRRRRA